MLSTYKNPDVSSIRVRVFFLFSFLLVSVFLPDPQESTHRMKPLSNGSFEVQTLQTRKNKHSQNQAFSSFVICSAAAETQAHTWGKSFSCFFQGHAYVTWGLLRLGRRGQEGVSHRTDPSCEVLEWWLPIDPERACGREITPCLLDISHCPGHPYLLQIRGNRTRVGRLGRGKTLCSGLRNFPYYLINL